ncbi:TonB-dependent receptor plug domain-containing protein [Amphritea balenae]|uniref:TonB-dependent receptor n=1 Tax=Amphritea balenae TaxID=452629 RepID=A0A3P1SQX2_9GAMM|nr:TonB-dependent receptor [Amphritea balenae]RRC99533.1 hypothetical protein EHS89_08470 [Amphritea balenae]GGK77805.1 hypothetical protein GCM10007941_29850 [Amphritea balenae]
MLFDSRPLLFILACSVQSVSAEEQNITELDYLNDLPITFAATRLPQRLSAAPASVTIIDRDMIDASSAITIPELLRLVPGMQSYHIATNASAASYHGMSDKFPPRMEVMIDGRSVYIPLFSAVIWETLPISIDDVERIEVVRGTNTVTQGSNAFLGAINIITNDPLSSRDNLVKYTSGEFDTDAVYGRFSSLHSLGNYSLSAGITGNEGNRFNNETQDPYFNRYLTFNTTLSPTLSDTFTINLGINSGYSSVGDINTKPDPKRREFETHYQNIEWFHQYDNGDVRLRYSHSVNSLEAQLLSVAEAAAAIDPPLNAFAGLLLERNAPYHETSEYGDIAQHHIELSATSNISPLSKVLTGFDYRLNQAKNNQLLNTLAWKDEESFRVFGHWELSSIPDWVINTGLSAEHSTTGSIRLSPRLAANYHLNPSLTLRSSVSRAYRMPSLLEANFESIVYVPDALLGATMGEDKYDYNFKINPNLKPEQLDTIDIGVLGNWPAYHSMLDIRFFYEDINDGITETNSDGDDVAGNGVHTYTNKAEWNNKGIEFQYKYQSGTGLKPLLVINYGYIQSSGQRVLDERPGDIDIDKLDSRNPRHTASALASITLPENLQLSLSHYYLSSVRWIEAARSSLDPGNSPYHRTDLKLSKSLQLSETNELKLSLIIQNLLDNPYSEFYANNIFEQRTYLQAQMSF